MFDPLPDQKDCYISTFERLLQKRDDDNDDELRNQVRQNLESSHVQPVNGESFEDILQ